MLIEFRDNLLKGILMVSSIDTALSGIFASSKLLEVSANNLANQFSTQTLQNGQISNTPYIPQKVDQISLSSGGVLAQVGNVNPATTTVPDPQGNGTIQQPNVDTANELIQQHIASYDFKANLKTIQTQDNLLKSLLDIVS